MKFGVFIFPGSNCDHDAFWAAKEIAQQPATILWHESQDLENCDCHHRSRRLLLRRLPAHRRHRRASRPSWRPSSEFAERGRPGHRHLQRLPDPVRGGPAARRAAAQNGDLQYRLPVHRVSIRVKTPPPPSPTSAAKGEVLQDSHRAHAKATTTARADAGQGAGTTDRSPSATAPPAGRNHAASQSQRVARTISPASCNTQAQRAGHDAPPRAGERTRAGLDRWRQDLRCR